MRLSSPVRPVLGGVRTYLPFAPPPKLTCPQGTRYCYAVWLRHLVLAAASGLHVGEGVVVELGPGRSLGAGLAALLTGATAYTAVDAVSHVQPRQTQESLFGLIDLLQIRAEIPGDDEFPMLYPRLPSYRFPHAVLTEARLRKALAPERIAAIGRDLLGLTGSPPPGLVNYLVGDQASRIEPGSVDLVFSQAVMQEVLDLPAGYARMAAWLRPGGVMSHQIGFVSQGLAEEWNGHLAYSDRTWRLITGRRAYVLNREPLSCHIAALAACGMEVVAAVPVTRTGGLARQRLNRRFRDMSDEDYTTAFAHILARKPAD